MNARADSCRTLHESAPPGIHVRRPCTSPSRPSRAECRHGHPPALPAAVAAAGHERSEEHTSELQSLMRISYAVFCLKKTKAITSHQHKRDIDDQQHSHL